MFRQYYVIPLQKSAKSLLLFAWMLAGTLILHAQAGLNDASFNPLGVGFGAGGGTVFTMAVQSDGKILVGGGFISYNGTARKCIARLNNDGTLDASFNPGTSVDGLPNSFSVNAIALQSDNKILIGGEFTSYNGTSRHRIVRVNSDGSLDGTFNPGTGFNGPGPTSFGTVTSIAVQADGKIVVGGFFTSFNGNARNRIARLNSNGSLDATFNPGTGADQGLYAVAIQDDGKIVIGGSFTTYNGTSQNFITRLKSNGSVDATFNTGTGAGNTVLSLALQSDNKIVISGTFASYNGTARNKIVRVNGDGTLDATFNPGAGAQLTDVYSLALQSDGKIVIGGAFTTYDGTGRNHLARINTDGSLDGSFDPGTGTDDNIYAISVQTDGKILIGGYFTTYRGASRNSIARIFDGSSVLPVTIQSIRATRQESNILIEWQVQNESNVTGYEIERCNDGSSFKKAGTKPTTGSATYTWTDHNVTTGICYYRIRMPDRDGSAKYSSVVKVIPGVAKNGFSIYPNPLQGPVLNLQITNQPSGVYSVKLSNAAGQAVLQRKISYGGGSGTESITLPENMQQGSYVVELTLPGGSRQVWKVIKNSNNPNP